MASGLRPTRRTPLNASSNSPTQANACQEPHADSLQHTPRESPQMRLAGISGENSLAFPYRQESRRYIKIEVVPVEGVIRGAEGRVEVKKIKKGTT
jgi:hypothetical protein